MLPSKDLPCFPVFEDNQGAEQLTRDQVPNLKSKHIDGRHHFLQGLVHQKSMTVIIYVSSKFQ